MSLLHQTTYRRIQVSLKFSNHAHQPISLLIPNRFKSKISQKSKKRREELEKKVQKKYIRGNDAFDKLVNVAPPNPLQQKVYEKNPYWEYEEQSHYLNLRPGYFLSRIGLSDNMIAKLGFDTDYIITDPRLKHKKLALAKVKQSQEKQRTFWRHESDTELGITQPKTSMPTNTKIMLFAAGLFFLQDFIFLSISAPPPDAEKVNDTDHPIYKDVLRIAKEVGFDRIEEVNVYISKGIGSFTNGTIPFGNCNLVLSNFFEDNNLESARNKIIIEGVEEISEKDKNTLLSTFEMTQEQKDFVIAHELIHAKENHPLILTIYRPINLLLLYTFFNTVPFFSSRSRLLCIVTFGWSVLTMSRFHMWLEERADKKAMYDFNNCEGALIHMDQLTLRNQIQRQIQNTVFGIPSTSTYYMFNEPYLTWKTGIAKNGDSVFALSHPTFVARRNAALRVFTEDVMNEKKFKEEWCAERGIDPRIIDNSQYAAFS